MDAGFLIVKRFAVLYGEFASRSEFDRAIYALPLFGTGPERLSVAYNGLDRDPLSAYPNDPALAAEMRMAELESNGRCEDSFLADQEGVVDVLAWCEGERPGVYEPVWARVAGGTAVPPAGYAKAGYEPSYFPNGYFSAVCDCMCFPRWHGTDPEGVLFHEHFQRLNQYGLFRDSNHAAEFLKYYLSFDWIERGD